MGGHYHFRCSHCQGHEHGSENFRIDTGHSTLMLEVFEDGVPPRFRIRSEGRDRPPAAAALTVETLRPDGARQVFDFADRGTYLKLLDEIPEPHEFTARVVLRHDDHSHDFDLAFVEHVHAEHDQRTAAPLASGRSDAAVIASFFALLTFSPCEGFLPVCLSGIRFGWPGFLMLSVVLAVATVVRMVVFTSATLSGLEKLGLQFLECYESGTLVLALGVGIICFGL